MTPITTRRSTMARTGSAAVTWVDRRHALVARSSDPDTTREVLRGADPTARYLARVVDAIGDAERVAILGPGNERLALEREYVSLYRRPERLVDVEPEGRIGSRELLARLRELTGSTGG